MEISILPEVDSDSNQEEILLLELKMWLSSLMVVERCSEDEFEISFTPDCTLSFQDRMNLILRARLVDDRFVSDMVRKIESGNQKIVFFRVGEQQSHAQLELEYKRRGLQPCDAHVLCEFNRQCPCFAEMYPNTTSWKCDDEWWNASLGWSANPGCNYVTIETKRQWYSEGWWFAGVSEVS
jgi:hypothetical protein